MTDIKQLDFVESGRFYLDEGELDYEITENRMERVIYAIRVGDETKYIGACQGYSTGLKKRIQGYKTPSHSAKTNVRLNEKIESKLNDGEDVTVWSLNPNQISYKGIELDMIMAMEKPIINQIEPEWNRH